MARIQYRPPFTLTIDIVSTVADIAKRVGRLSAAHRVLMLGLLDHPGSCRSGGKGRMGWLWQTLLLSHWNPVFAWLPVASLVHRRQAAYYQAIRESTKATDCGPFIAFMLDCIDEAVAEATSGATEKTTGKAPGAELTIHRALRKLREAGRLHRIGPDTGGHWEVIEQ